MSFLFNKAVNYFHPTRRGFLQAAVLAVASLALPKFLVPSKRPAWFVNTENWEAWAVDDPVSWSLDNARQPILERARERLVQLTASDDTRIIRLVTRRCNLNLIELFPKQVVVHYWGQQGQGDLRPFFKQHGLARKSVKVILLDRKRELVTRKPGDDFLYGERFIPFWPVNRFWTKWQRRCEEESNDWTTAPFTWSGYGWEGCVPNLIPWAALKSAWRRTAPFVCLNCDIPAVLVNFGLPQCGFLTRQTLFIHACRNCRRLFRDDLVDSRDVEKWMVANLDAEVLPNFMMWMGRPGKWNPPSLVPRQENCVGN